MNKKAPQHHLLLFLRQFVNLHPEEISSFENITYQKEFDKNEIFIREGETCDRVYFVVNGLCRHFFTDKDGNEITAWFSEPGMMATDYKAFTEGGRCLFNIQAQGTTSCEYIYFSDLQHLYDTSKNFERLGRLVNQSYLNQLIERNTSMVTKSAKQRYDEFTSQKAHLFNSVLLKHIASYLGMSLETLSRLRAGSYNK